MKKPTLEEVKEYFKNAKTVKNRFGKEFEPFKIVHGHCPNSFMNINPNDYDSDGATVWEEEKGYAKILTYKEKTFSITESQIKELCSPSFRTNEERLKEMFLEAFESEVKLEVGKWYFVERSKSQFDDKQRALVFYEDKEKIYGFTHGGWWCNDYGNPKYDKYKFTEATEEEVFEALKNEAVKLGYKEKDVITDIYYSGWCTLNANSFEYNRKCLWLGDCVLFKDGKWAEKTITLSEAEQQLGKKIIV